MIILSQLNYASIKVFSTEVRRFQLLSFLSVGLFSAMKMMMIYNNISLFWQGNPFSC